MGPLPQELSSYRDSEAYKAVLKTVLEELHPRLTLSQYRVHLCRLPRNGVIADVIIWIEAESWPLSRFRVWGLGFRV